MFQRTTNFIHCLLQLCFIRTTVLGVPHILERSRVPEPSGRGWHGWWAQGERPVAARNRALSQAGHDGRKLRTRTAPLHLRPKTPPPHVL